MKILFAVTHSEPGGLVEIWSDIASGLAARGHETQCLALYPNGENARLPSNWRHIAERRPTSVFAALALLRRLVADLRQCAPDIVVTAMPAANILLPVAVALSRRPIRVVTSHHSPAQTHNPMLDHIDGWTGRLRCVKAIVSVSSSVGRSLWRKAPAYRAKALVIGNALPPAIEARIEALHANRPTRASRWRIVALGRLSHQKNYPFLLAAMVYAPQAELAIIGSGEDEAALTSLARELGVSERVTFMGHMPRAAALAQVAQGDIFVQVSHYEGHSLALIEAARLGLPLIVSDVPVQVEGITAHDGTPCGQVVPLDNPALLGRKLVELLESPGDYAFWAQRSRALGLEASHAAMLDQYEALLEAQP